MSKSKPAWPRMAAPSSRGLAPALQHGLQRLEQVAVLAAQVDQAAPRADDMRRRCVMPSNTASAWRREQHAVLEGAGLALVGIAHHHVLAARRLAAQRPLQAGGEAGAAAAAQVGALHLGQHRRGAARQRRRQRRARAPAARPSSTSARRMLSCTSNHSARPLRHRHAAADQLGHLRHARRVQPGDHLVVIDQQRRALVAQAGAGGARPR